jgi:hypothetical protein
MWGDTYELPHLEKGVTNTKVWDFVTSLFILILQLCIVFFLNQFADWNYIYHV